MPVAAITSLIVGAVVYNAVSASIPDVPKIEDRGRDVKEVLNPNYNLPIVYGEQRLGGNIVFYDVSGTNNKYLDVVVAICEGEIEGYTKVYLNDGAYPIFDGYGSTLAKETLLYTTHPLYGQTKASGDIIIPRNLTKWEDILVRNSYGTARFQAYFDFAIGATLSDTITNLVNYLNASSNPVINKATYTKRSDGRGIHIEYDIVGTGGNNHEFWINGYDYKTSSGRKIWTNYDLCSLTLSGGNDINYISAYFYNGTDAQTANSQLISTYPPVGSPGDSNYSSGWTSAHTLSGIAYMYIRMEYNPDLFSGGIPKFSFEIKGRKIYDPRTTTTAYSDNPALCLRDYLLNTRFGKSLDSSVLDETSIINAANDCEVSRSGLDVTGSPVTYNTYAIGAIIDSSKLIKDNVANILQSMNATLPFFDGNYYLKILKAGSSVVSFNEDNIIGKIDVASSSKKNRLNKVLITFPDKQRHFKKGDAPIESSIYLSEDNNQTLEKRIDAPYINYFPRAVDLAELTMNVSRAGLSIEFTATMEAFKAVSGDIIDITYPLFGWTNKEFRLEKIVSRLDGLCDIFASEHNDAFYNLTDKQEQIGSSETNLIDPREVLKPEIDSILSDSSTHLINVDGTITPRIYISWTNVDAYPYYYNIYLKKAIDSTYTKVGQITKDDITEFYIPNVEWDTDYDVGISVVNGIGYTSQISTTSVTVPNPLSNAVYDYPDVKGLELIGEGTDLGKGNDTGFTGKDIKLQWRLSSNNVTYEFGSIAAEQLGAVGGVLPFTLKGYKIQVYHPTDINPRQEYFVTDPSFIYTLDKNIEDGNGVPSRTVTFKVTAVGQVAGYTLTGESEIPAKITVTNPAPSLPNNVVISKGFQTISLNYDRPQLADWSGILVWMDSVSGFTPSISNLVYSGTDNTVILSGLISGSTYYIKYALIDTFVDTEQKDATGLTLSAENSITTDVAVTSSEIQSLIADKIAAGTLGEAVALGGVFVASGTEAVLNGTGPTLGTYRLDLGPVAHTGATYVVNFYNGYDDAHGSYDSKFSVDSNGNAIFGGDLTLKSESTDVIKIDSSTKAIWINSSTYGNTGIQMEYNSGSPRIFVGDSTGSLVYNSADGIKLSNRLSLVGYITSSSVAPVGTANYLQIYGGSGDANAGTINMSGYVSGILDSNITLNPGSSYIVNISSNTKSGILINTASTLGLNIVSSTGAAISASITNPGATSDCITSVNFGTGIGLWARGVSNVGVYGRSDTNSYSAIEGYNTSTSGASFTTAAGIYGHSLHGPGGVFTSNSTLGCLLLDNRSAASKPSSVTAYQISFIGGELAYTDGTNWKRVRDNTVL